jgi:hypothetical protein
VIRATLVSSDSFKTIPASAETHGENKKANKNRKALEAFGREHLRLGKMLHNIGARRCVRFSSNNRTSGISLQKRSCGPLVGATGFNPQSLKKLR